jgi:hypothetical protein
VHAIPLSTDLTAAALRCVAPVGLSCVAYVATVVGAQPEHRSARGPAPPSASRPSNARSRTAPYTLDHIPDPISHPIPYLSLTLPGGCSNARSSSHGGIRAPHETR